MFKVFILLFLASCSASNVEIQKKSYKELPNGATHYGPILKCKEMRQFGSCGPDFIGCEDGKDHRCGGNADRDGYWDMVSGTVGIDPMKLIEWIIEGTYK